MPGGESLDPLLRPYIHGQAAGGDETTRLLHKLLPLSVQAALRDYLFKELTDSFCGLLAVPLSVTDPSRVLRFLRLGWQRKLVRYGPSALHNLHEFPATPTNAAAAAATVLVFVHGGAWGSGRPWMYRLVASGISEAINASSTVVVEYPVWPAATILEQRDSIIAALKLVREEGREQHSNRRVVLCGHSSGANVCALALLEHEALADAFIALSGVYDIAKHYLFEKSRGVHVISPMGAAALHPARSHEASPTLILERRTQISKAAFPPTLVLHGTQDTTVPVTSSVDFANALLRHGVRVQTGFPANYSHMDPISHMLSTNSTSTATYNYLSAFESSLSLSPPRSRL